ncbi:MAG: MBL fold metallo-hydrolase [Chitinispirillia bacterium]|nr:MBL fold metallo-hydrolase [Chitinispirillia bacterium]
MSFISGDRQVLLFRFFQQIKPFTFRILFGASFLSLFIYCSDLSDDNLYGDKNFTFTVADVGQGLAQFGVCNDKAIVWDMGSASQYSAWRGAYERLGRPVIEMIVISHSDEDHFGGLSRLGNDTKWNGTVAVSPFEDTAKIRERAGDWSSRINFRFFTRGDSIKLFDFVDIICLWPPHPKEIADTEEFSVSGGPLNGMMRNRLSLVFSVAHGHNRALVTSDIDSVAMSAIAAHSGYDLRAQIFVVPHHASAGSVNTLFFSYVSPQNAVISCSRTNSYGHPSRRMLDALLDSGASIFYTYIDGTLTFESNGYYWSVRN